MKKLDQCLSGSGMACRLKYYEGTWGMIKIYIDLYIFQKSSNYTFNFQFHVSYLKLIELKGFKIIC